MPKKKQYKVVFVSKYFSVCIRVYSNQVEALETVLTPSEDSAYYLSSLPAK